MKENTSAIDLVFDARYRKLRDSIAEKYFPGSGGKRDACLFAMSIGIKHNKRIPRNKWSNEKPLSWDDLDRLRARIGDIEVLFTSLDLKKDKISTKEIIDEFVTGGMKYIDDNALDEDGNLCEIS